jgi:hypothetical protein
MYSHEHTHEHGPSTRRVALLTRRRFLCLVRRSPFLSRKKSVREKAPPHPQAIGGRSPKNPTPERPPASPAGCGAE